ncbi:MAG: hypothetical protein WCA04_09910 [Geobacteraceae bacterium]
MAASLAGNRETAISEWIEISNYENSKLAKILYTSKKITILGVAGCARTHAELIELAGRLNAPIVHAMRGKEVIEYDKHLLESH